MRETERDQFVVILGTLAEAFSKPLSDGLVRVYFTELSDYSIAEIETGAKYLLHHCKFWPTIAEFREAISGSDADRAEKAWLSLLHAIAKGSSWISFVTDDAALAKTIRHLFGSWDEVCRVVGREDSHEMLAHWRNRFNQYYRYSLKQSTASTALHYFPCRSTLENRLSRETWRPEIQHDISFDSCIGVISGRVEMHGVDLDSSGRMIGEGHSYEPRQLNAPKDMTRWNDALGESNHDDESREN